MDVYYHYTISAIGLCVLLDYYKIFPLLLQQTNHFSQKALFLEPVNKMDTATLGSFRSFWHFAQSENDHSTNFRQVPSVSQSHS